MIDAQTIHLASIDQIEYQAVRGIKYLRIFHAQAGQVVDVKKSPVIDFIARDPPVGQSEGLRFKQFMQHVKTCRRFRPRH